MHKMAANLYVKLEAVCEAHIERCVGSLVGGSQDPSVFLSCVEKAWSDHCDQMGLIRNLFLYLDRTYVLQTASVTSLWYVPTFMHAACVRFRLSCLPSSVLFGPPPDRLL